MKHHTSALTLLAVLMCGSASAGDYYPYVSRNNAPPPYPAPAPYLAPPPGLWTGFYAGLNLGGTFSGNGYVDTSTAAIAPTTPPMGFAFASSASRLASLNNVGFIGGGQIGYNFQLSPVLIAGLEADIQGLTGSVAANQVGFSGGVLGSVPVTFGQIQRNLDYLGTVRARLGYLLTPTLLFYATGGLAYGGANLQANYASFDAHNVFGPGVGATTLSDTAVGYSVGGGAEWMFLPNWSAKLEYLYYDLGSISTPGAAVVGAAPAGIAPWAYSAKEVSRFNGHVIRAGVNYHFLFGAPPPVVGKY
jgi:outer membrane immunogenic protein